MPADDPDGAAQPAPALPRPHRAPDPARRDRLRSPRRSWPGRRSPGPGRPRGSVVTPPPGGRGGLRPGAAPRARAAARAGPARRPAAADHRHQRPHRRAGVADRGRGRLRLRPLAADRRADLAAHTRPDRSTDGELLVIADWSAWATQVRLLARTLVRSLNSELGQGTVTRVKVRGPEQPRRPGEWRVRAVGGHATRTAETQVSPRSIGLCRWAAKRVRPVVPRWRVLSSKRSLLLSFDARSITVLEGSRQYASVPVSTSARPASAACTTSSTRLWTTP